MKRVNLVFFGVSQLGPVLELFRSVTASRIEAKAVDDGFYRASTKIPDSNMERLQTAVQTLNGNTNTFTMNGA